MIAPQGGVGRRFIVPEFNFAGRLLLAHVVVLGVALAVSEVASWVIGPAIPSLPDLVRLEHVAASLGVAFLAALALSWYLSGRVGRSVTNLARAAAAVADGRYDYRIERTDLGRDFSALATAFNQMAARLESVEETRHRLFRDLAHEIRTPVSVLQAYTDAIEDGVKSFDPETIGVIRDQTRRLVRFSEDFAALAQAEESHVSIAAVWVAPRELIDAAVGAAADRFADKGVTLSADIDDGLPPVWVDPHRFAHILTNLFNNALRHTPAGGRVEVAARHHHNQLTLAVTDNGEGVPAEHLPHLFEHFYRVSAARDRNHGGAGMGLAIVRALVNAHGGHIDASSPGPGLGTTLTFTMPIKGASQ